MPAVSWDERAFRVGSRPVWVVSGAVHYFRVPRGLWRDRLLKLKRAGCNTVETYVAWNFHEREEGAFDFSGDADLDAFLSLAEELGLWIIVRPGPYICAEWDNGGLPAWLGVKKGVRAREANNIYHSYIRRWFEELIPIIAAHQPGCGGRVILVQDENEYCFRNRPGGREHLEFLRNLMRTLGITVPIVVCNMLFERVPGVIDCWNGWADAARGVNMLKHIQPSAPALVTEFWAGWYDAWGKAEVEPAKSARQVHAKSLEIIARGGMYSYYMFHGGTNFNAWPGRTLRSDHTYITTSHDYGAPISETGALTEKYYDAKLAATFAGNMAAFLADSDPSPLTVRSRDKVEIITRLSPAGQVIFVFNRSGRKTAKIHLPGSVTLDLSFRDLDALALPYNFSPVPGFTIEYSNLSILAMMPMGVGRLVFLYGPRGVNAVLSAQGRTFRRRVSDQAQVWFGNFPNLVAVLDTGQARRTWLLEDRTVVGGDFVGETDGERVVVANRGEDGNIVSYFPNGKVNYATCAAAAELPALPKLGPWRKRALLPDGAPPRARRVDDGEGGFAAPETLGWRGGYGWYHTTIEAEKAGRRTLLFTDGEDRLTVFVNGRRFGVFGRGEGASTGLVEMSLRKGPNDLHVLLDHLGRCNFGLALCETKGIRGGVYLDAREASCNCKWTAGRYDGRLVNTWQMETWWPEAKGIATSLAAVFAVKPGESVVYRITGVGEPAAVFVNRRFHSYFWGTQDLHKLDLVLPSHLFEKGKNLIELAFFVKPGADVRKNCRVYAYREDRPAGAKWVFAPLAAPKAKGASRRSRAGAPAAWEATFKRNKPAAPVVLVTEGLEKGEVWLNGHSVGRHWKIGPQERLYLPEPWFKRNNRLLVVDEYGTRPSAAVRLEYDEAAAMHFETL